jgi:CDP-diacylglycerol---glycerol-3-phosphate 3-phosphatidyltransferase
VSLPTAQSRGAGLLVPITALRIAVIPLVMALILLDGDGRTADVGAAVLFSLAAVTDFVDGFLARRWAVTTTLGSFLDTTADKLLVSGALLALVAEDRASPWIAAIIVGRELVVMGLRGVVAAEGTVFAPSVWGKLKTNVQFLAIILAILRYDDRLGPLYLDEWAMLAAALITVLSAVEYFTRFSWAMGASGSRR